MRRGYTDSICLGYNYGVFSRLNTQCGPSKVVQLKFSCPFNLWPFRLPKSVTNKNGTFPCGQSINTVNIQQIPFVSVFLSVYKNGRRRTSTVVMGIGSYLMALDGVLIARSGNVG